MDFQSFGAVVSDVKSLYYYAFVSKKLNDKTLKYSNEICLKWEHWLKQETISREKILQLITNTFFEKWICSSATLFSTFCA